MLISRRCGEAVATFWDAAGNSSTTSATAVGSPASSGVKEIASRRLGRKRSPNLGMVILKFAKD